MTEQTDLVPKRRFKEFLNSHAWEQRELGEVADIIGGGTPSTSNKEYWDGGIDWYSPVEIGERTYVNSSQKKITNLGLQKSSAKILPIGTVLFTSRAGIGNTAILAKEGATNQGFQSIVPHKDQLDSYFIYSRTHELKCYGETNGAGSTFVEVSGKQMAKMPMLIPALEEQREIGGFFEQLDYLISLHQRKLEKTKALKSAYLSEMFPAEGESEPKRRFAGFTGAWEQRTLGGILAEKISNGIMNQPGANELNIRHINVVNLYSPSYIHLDELEYINATEKDLKRCNVEVGDIFLTRSSLKVEGIAQANILLDDGTFVFDDHIMRIKLANEFDPFFVKESLNHSPIKREFMAKSKTGTMTTIGQDDIASSAISFPTKAEQVVIGNYFLTLDHLITLHQRKLEKLQNLKKAYLNVMFV